MKKYPCYLLALLLLSACKQQGEVKYTLTTEQRNGVVPVNGASIYFMPADSVDVANAMKYWDDSNYDNRPEMLESMVKNVDYAYEYVNNGIKNAKTTYELDSFKHMHFLLDSLTKDRIKRMPQAEIDYKKSEEATRLFINNFMRSGTLCTTDGAGTCTATLPAGKYRMLIKNNVCSNKYLPPSLYAYQFDSVTVIAGKTATVNTLLNKCKY